MWNAQLFAGAQHAARFHTTHFGGLDFEIPWQNRTWQGAGDFGAHCDIRCAADNLHQCSRAHIDLGHAQAVGVFMRAQGFDFGNDHTGKRRSGGGGAFDL